MSALLTILAGMAIYFGCMALLAFPFLAHAYMARREWLALLERAQLAALIAAGDALVVALEQLTRHFEASASADFTVLEQR